MLHFVGKFCNLMPNCDCQCIPDNAKCHLPSFNHETMRENVEVASWALSLCRSGTVSSLPIDKKSSFGTTKRGKYGRKKKNGCQFLWTTTAKA